MLGNHSQSVVGQLIKRREHRSHNPAVRTVGSNQTNYPSQIRCQQKTRKRQKRSTQNAFLLAVAVLVFLLAEPSDYILHHTQGADDGAVDTAKQQRQGYQKQQRSNVHSHQSRQELNLGHPSQIHMSRTGEVQQQPRYQNPEDEGQRNSYFS